MDREKLKLVYKNLKSLLNVLESEIYSDPDAYTTKGDEPSHYYNSNDDDDGYTD